ncbi:MULTISPECIES: GNAT family N-acetyltransferase [Pseudidiomarina]|uniref:ElaA protein n=2 Tax=Pseudidiomarina TaxID=2800384 RepID=A0A368UMP3_9GAMM|nr:MULTISPECIES: GNAT family N-acetyltransferase [Pseudidiomarina]PWW10437.1 ElaA protein [Pseudidiomarina maritima]RBP88077.1 ElaA protein [Pseudidiomarina tainanensis]RCW30088.1 ElaA protein [Pseudidiomarina tainanensis]
MNWQLKSFSQLSTSELYTILKVRQEVFVVEQTCPYLDTDGKDPQALHLVAWDASSTEAKLCAYARIFIGDAHTPSRIGRVLTANHARGRGLGRELMQRAITICQQHAKTQPIQIGAQVYLRDFYQSLGFIETSAEYLEDDIPHVDMERAV